MPAHAAGMIHMHMQLPRCNVADRHCAAFPHKQGLHIPLPGQCTLGKTKQLALGVGLPPVPHRLDSHTHAVAAAQFVELMLNMGPAARCKLTCFALYKKLAQNCQAQVGSACYEAFAGKTQYVLAPFETRKAAVLSQLNAAIILDWQSHGPSATMLTWLCSAAQNQASSAMPGSRGLLY